MTQRATSRRRELTGQVIGDKMEKTITVLIETRFRHPLYKKVLRQRKKVYAHDERQAARVGDLVRLVESRPLSRLKRWRLVEVLRRGNRP